MCERGIVRKDYEEGEREHSNGARRYSMRTTVEKANEKDFA